MNTSLLFEKMGGRLNVDFKNRLKFDLLLRSYIYSERGNFAASFYNKNSILMFFPKQSILGRGAGGHGALIDNHEIPFRMNPILINRVFFQYYENKILHK